MNLFHVLSVWIHFSRTVELITRNVENKHLTFHLKGTKLTCKELISAPRLYVISMRNLFGSSKETCNSCPMTRSISLLTGSISKVKAYDYTIIF
ncbi:hypothetical protein EE612_006071 [Oryza sativa]|nr:hypothetical protein EE612_006071 [Oryza sativa]